MTPPNHSRRSSSRNNWGTPPWAVAFRPRRKPLPERVDFVVVGGGFAGLSAAAHLKRYAPRTSVLLLEAGSLGNGASGRTGGMALDETAAGKLPGAEKVLAGYRKILRNLQVHADVSLPGAWEIARGGAAPSLEGEPAKITFQKNSPISWTDSGNLRIARKVPGGTVNPGKIITGLARAAEKSGVQIVEHAEVASVDFTEPVRLTVERKSGSRSRRHVVSAARVLLATNAGAIDAAALPAGATPRLTFALATAPLTRAQIATIGLAHAQPFYTVDLPYLWGRRFAGNRLIFGSGLVPAFGESLSHSARRQTLWGGLEHFSVRKGAPAVRLRSLEKRVRGLHPVLKRVGITHRWCGPILITKDWHPVFRRHPKSARALVLGGFSGHGVALSVFLGRWAAQALLRRRALPNWG